MSDSDAVVKRLDVLIAFSFEKLRSQEQISQGKLLKTMKDVGLTPSEIGKIINREGKDVSATITMYEKSLKNKAKKGNEK